MFVRWPKGSLEKPRGRLALALHHAVVIILGTGSFPGSLAWLGDMYINICTNKETHIYIYIYTHACMHSCIYMYRGKPFDYQHHVVVDFRCVAIWLYWEYENVILAVIEASTVRLY